MLHHPPEVLPFNGQGIPVLICPGLGPVQILIETGRQGKEKCVTVTAEGAKACVRYREVREHLLLKAMGEIGVEAEQVSRLAGVLRALSGHYDQAARSAAAY